MQPVSGQVVYVEQFGLDRWWLDGHAAEGPTYVIPRSHDVVVGGTDVEGDWSRTPSPATARVDPRRAPPGWCRTCGRRAGDPAQGGAATRCDPPSGSSAMDHVVHCYGHGGAGVTLSWGCADEVVELLAAPVQAHSGRHAAE